MADKRQLNLYPDRLVLNRLEQIAARFQRPRTQVALDILETYMDMWVLAQQAKENVVKEQEERLREYIKGGKASLTNLPKAHARESVNVAKKVKR